MVCFRPQPVAAGYAVRNSALSRRVDGSTSHAGVAGLPVMPGVACFAEFSPPACGPHQRWGSGTSHAVPAIIVTSRSVTTSSDWISISSRNIGDLHSVGVEPPPVKFFPTRVDDVRQPRGPGKRLTTPLCSTQCTIITIN
jgi:hypothetical protein